jgi:histidinol-phosphatase
MAIFSQQGAARQGATDADLDVALALADAADAISMGRFQADDLSIMTKPDMTPVSDADRAVEQALTAIIRARRPGDAILGEEFGTSGDSARRWVLDPIDGTKNFVRGVPVWATLIALMDGEQVLAGVVSAPALGRRWWAARGAGAWATALGGPPRRLRVSGVSELADASVDHSGLARWPSRDGVLELVDQTWRSRGYGDFWGYALVAEGAVEVAVEPAVELWDVAPLAILVTEAGGRFTDRAGRPGPAGGSAVATNGVLHDTALSYLA